MTSVAEVSGQQYPEHMCSQVTRPGVTETPPDLHKPTPGPHMSIFHEMMVSYDDPEDDQMVSDDIWLLELMIMTLRSPSILFYDSSSHAPGLRSNLSGKKCDVIT